jgi:beta-xylosidase
MNSDMKTYRNPVWPGDFADPFVLRTGTEQSPQYFAYGTAPLGADGRPFPVLFSSDLVTWHAGGGSLDPLTHPPARSYWAPEVAERDGRFYMYYSASTTDSDADQRVRVAIAEHPAGPFRTVDKLLIDSLDFTIDASPFQDPQDGRWYLFFATDYLNEPPSGTGLGVIELAGDMISVAGDPKIVLRASGDWQIYERNRHYKGRVWPAWYCIEGPHVTFHAGKYYCFYSGGAWHGTEYGVGFATADHPLGPWRGGSAIAGPTVLKGIPGLVIGPGHNSVVLGPDNQTLFMVYHAWDPGRTARRMCIDPIRWTEAGPKVDGPSIQSRSLLAR